MRGPDVFYVRADHIPSSGILEAFCEIAPDLAVEIVSPDESAEEVRDYLAAGSPLVWVIYPRRQEVVAHTPDGLVRTYSNSDVLEHRDILPGFACVVQELFD